MATSKGRSMQNRLFVKYGHVNCQLQSTREELVMRTKSNACSRFYYRFFMISELNRRSLAFLRSSKAIDDEMLRQYKFRFVIHPFSRFRLFWEIVMIITYLILFVIIPLRLIEYQGETVFHDSGIFLYAMHSICLVDIILNFFTGYVKYAKHVIVLKPSIISRKYLCTYFLIDVIATIPHDYVYRCLNPGATKEISQGEFYLNLLYLTRLLRCYSLYQYCGNSFKSLSANVKKYVLFQLATCAMIFILYIHMVACISAILTEHLHPVQVVHRNGKNVFLPRNDTEAEVNPNFNICHLYLTYFYQSSLMATFTGVGVLQVKSMPMQLYITLIWLIAYIIFTMFVAYIYNTIVSTSSSRRQYDEKLQELNKYMRYKCLPGFLQKRINNYYEFRFQHTFFRESEIMNSISSHLRQDVSMFMCKKLVENVRFFKNLPPPLFGRIVNSLKYEVYMENDVITKANTAGDSMYFISVGTVAVYSKTGKEICHLDDGNHFGEVAMVMEDDLRVASVIAIEMCEMYSLIRNDFYKAMLPYPEILEKIKQIASDRVEQTGTGTFHKLANI